MTTIFSLTTTLSHLLVTLSPFCILSSIAHSKRSVVAISGETLVLLTLSSVYFALPDLLSFGDVAAKIHILALGIAAYYVVKFQSKMYIPDSAQSLLPLRPSDSAEAVTSQEREEREEEGEEDERPTKKIPDLVNFTPSAVVFFLIHCFIMALVSGDHSLVTRFLKWYFADPKKPNEAFWTTDVPHMTYYFFILIHTNSIVFQYGRITAFHRFAALLKAQVGEKIAKKLKVPKGVWAFLVTFQVSQGFMLPALIKQLTKIGTEDEGKEDLTVRIVGAAVGLAYLPGLLLLLRFMPKPKKEEDTEVREQTAEVNQQTASSA